MRLTLAEEESLIIKYEPFLNRMVSIYMTRAKFPMSGHREDLMQEARIALLGHIRRMENMDEIFKSYIYIVSAMCRYKETMNVLRIPHKEHVEKMCMYMRVSVDLLDGMPAVEDDMIFDVMFQEFLATLNPSERKALLMKLDGYTNREIMFALGLKNDTQVSRHLKRLGSKYKGFAKADNGEEIL